MFQDLAGGGDIAQQMQVSHDALVKKVAVSESNPGYSAPHDGLAMNFEQKRRLSIAIGQLPGDRISEVMRIIAEDESMQARVHHTVFGTKHILNSMLKRNTTTNMQ